MTFFVKYPPHGDTHFLLPKIDTTTWPDGHSVPPEWMPFARGSEPQYYNAARQICQCKDNFEQTGNPLYALEAFRLATAAKVYPPLWVLEFIDERFRYAMAGTASLDRAFGFNQEGLGSGRRIDLQTQDRLRARNWKLCLVVFKLEGAGLSRPQACKALASLLYRLPAQQALHFGDRKHTLRRMNITGKGIEKAVRESEHEWAAERAEATDAAQSWSHADKRSLLSVFYKSELPRKIVRDLKL